MPRIAVYQSSFDVILPIQPSVQPPPPPVLGAVVLVDSHCSRFKGAIGFDCQFGIPAAQPQGWNVDLPDLRSARSVAVQVSCFDVLGVAPSLPPPSEPPVIWGWVVVQ